MQANIAADSYISEIIAPAAENSSNHFLKRQRKKGGVPLVTEQERYPISAGFNPQREKVL